MRVFDADVERRAFDHGRLRDWRAWGLLAQDKFAAASAVVGDAPVHAAWPLRVLLFGFGVLMLGAVSLLFLKDQNGRAASAWTALLLAGGAIGLAEAAISALKIRRFGAEEALVAGAVLLASYGSERLLGGGSSWRFEERAFFTMTTAAAALAYARYGYRLAAFGACIAVGLLVASFEKNELFARPLLAALYAALLAAATYWPGLEDRERARLQPLRFALALAVPLILNLRLEQLLQSSFWREPATSAYGLATLTAIFLIPVAWLAWGARSRSRALMWAGTLGVIVAQCSIKPYFKLPRHSWDPAVLGAELMLLSLALKRWLETGPGGRRGAFTSEALGEAGPGAAASLLAVVAAASPNAAPSGPAAPPKGGGGSFGGGGASGSF